MGGVAFERVSKVYPDGTKAVTQLDLEAADGELLVLVGPSGCGKTSALRMVAGLEEISAGLIHIGSRVINDVAPEQRDVAMVFQNYALFPHLTVYENIGFGLKVRRVSKQERDTRVRDISRVLGLDEQLRKKPKALSGGQRQRVAMARAIVRDPSVLLMDEPLSNLDAALRVQLRGEIARIQRRLGATTIYVTHDQVEAMTMGDRIAVMRAGLLQQVAAPRDVFDEPANMFVARFVGSPPMNLLEGALTPEGDGASCRVGGDRLDVPASILAERPGLREHFGRKLAVGVRPDAVRAAVAPSGAATGNALRGVTTATEVLGTETLVHVEMSSRPVVTAEVIEIAADLDESVVATLDEQAASQRTSFVARLKTRDAPRVGEPLGLAIDVEQVRFFDLDTGAAVSRAELSASRADPVAEAAR